MASNGEYPGPLAGLPDQWIAKIGLARKVKREVFGRFAEECSRYVGPSPHDFVFRHSASSAFSIAPHEDARQLPFQVTINKGTEYRDLFGPHIYSRNPVRTVRPHELPVPPPELFASLGPNGEMLYQELMFEAEQRKATHTALASVLESYLNVTPRATDLRRNSRAAVEEALVKGRGTLWTEAYQLPGSRTWIVGSFFDSVDFLFIDPDAELLRTAWWVARERISPIWEVEEKFNLPPGSLKGNLESANSASDVLLQEDGNLARMSGQSNDLCRYYEVWSKMGIGDKLCGVDNAVRRAIGPFDELQTPYMYLAVMQGCPYFLNLHPKTLQAPRDEENVRAIRDALDWPVPFWVTGGWPVSTFDPKPGDAERKAWGTPPLTPALGELAAVDWIISMILTKLRSTTRDLIAVPQDTDPEIVRTIQRGEDLSFLRYQASSGRSVKDIIEVLQFPSMNADAYKVLEMLLQMIDKRIGTNELMYAETSRQIRSGTEAAIRGDQMALRPADMGVIAEDWMKAVAINEALAAKYVIEPERDIEPIFGRAGRAMWEATVQSVEPAAIIRELLITIEPGSARKPNIDRDVENTREDMQYLMPQMWAYYQMSNDPQPANVLLSRWAKARGEPTDSVLIQPVQQQPMPEQPPVDPGGGEVPPEEIPPEMLPQDIVPPVGPNYTDDMAIPPELMGMLDAAAMAGEMMPTDEIPFGV